MGKSRKYTDEQFIKAVKESKSIGQVLKKLNLRTGGGGNYKSVIERIRQLCMDISHWGDIRQRQSWAKGTKRIGKYFIPLDKILVEDSYFSSNNLRKRLIQEKFFEPKCYSCGNTTWMGKGIPLELDHKNGNNRDNRLENLTILCPNCHAQTNTYCSKNRQRYKNTNEHKNLYTKADKPKPKVTRKSIVVDFNEVSVLLKKLSTKEVGRQLGVSENVIRGICKRRGFKIPYKHEKYKKFNTTKEELEKMVNTMPMTKIGEHFGVCDNAIKKRCKKLGIEITKNRRGYWAKVYANK